MWTTSSSPVELRLLAVAAVACVLSCVTTPPDAPRPAAELRVERPPAIPPTHLRPVELATVRALRPDEKLARFAGRAFLEQARDPVAIEVTTAHPLPQEARDSSPAIVLNGETFPDTWAFSPNTLVAFVPDRARLRDVNSVEVVWIGAETLTRSPKPLSFRRADIQ
jgi:hypothetical protein